MTHQLLTQLPALLKMETIDLTEMKSIKLMNRVDTKYITNVQILNALLEMALTDYRIQQINNETVNSYQTIYFDTPTCDMYLMHHNRKLRRQKIRIRTYLASQESFLEIKNKTNKGRTKKIRVALAEPSCNNLLSNPKIVDFLNAHSIFKPEILSPQLRTSFDRITLVNRAKTERLTIDTNLRFANFSTHEQRSLQNLMIVELKQDGSCQSEMKRILQNLRIIPKSISKYCVGTVLTNPTVKNNRFKCKIRNIEKIENNL